jgi:uncharacterized protein
VIIIDADACPGKDAIVALARQYKEPVLLVASHAHDMPDYEGVRVRKTDCSPQAVDLVIMNEVKPGDIVITQDYGLAAVVLGKKALAVSPRGMQFTEGNITELLEARNLHARIRRGGGRVKGPSAYTRSDQELLLSLLQSWLAQR